MAAPLIAPASGYRPRRRRSDLKDIIEDGLDELIASWDERYRAQCGPLHPRVRELMERYVRCGDPHFGCLRLRCVEPGCQDKDERIVPLSCKSRGICPSCGQMRAIRWADRMAGEVLPEVDYVAVTFTIPKILRRYFLWDRSLYGDLCRAAYAAARLYLAAQFPALRRCAPAAVVSPQSWGSLLNFHPHTHGLLSLGVFSPEGTFHPLEGPLDTAVVRELFEAEVFRFLLRKDLISEERVALVRSWRHSGFHLSAERTIAAGERGELEGVLQYMERPPVSLRRLEYRGDGRVLYRGKYHPGLKTDHRLVSAVDFLALLVPHIALRYECRIHRCGAISSTWRRRGVLRGAGDAGGESDAARGQAAPGAQGEGEEEQVVGEAEQAEQRAAGRREVVALEADEQSAFVRLRRRSWGRLIAKVWLDDPSLCRCCGKPMKILAAFSSPRDDAVIEKILRCRGEFDPPWRRERRARGPPDRSGAGGCDVLDALEYAQLGPEVAEEDCSQLAPEDAEDQYSQLPPSEDDPS